ncbi:MAG TPA: AAA family ATPase [Baekduia sp.]|nr:AAA family ATPase [Baekduia sp.]
MSATAQAARRGPFAGSLHGRGEELAAIGEGLAATRRGEGAVLLVQGPPGIGRSRLLAEARAMGRRAGVRPLCGHALERQQAVPFAPLLAVTVGADPPIGDARSVRLLSGQEHLRYWLVNDLRAALEAAALETPLAIVLDDLQWADTGTAVALSLLAEGLRDAPILWILGLRDGEGAAAMRATTMRLVRGGARRLVLGDLSPAAVEATVDDLLEVGAAPALLELATRAQGNPSLLVQLVEGLREDGRLGIERGRAVAVGDELPRRLIAATQARLDRLSGDARQVVCVAAVLAHRFSVEQLAAMLRRRPSALVGPVAEALRADLLAGDDELLGFRHDLLRQAVLETHPRSLRRALQREAAGVLLASGAAPVEAALQLAACADVGDRVAIATLHDAARAVAGTDAAAAADLDARALELLPPGDGERAPLVAETVVALDQALRSAEALELASRALAGVLVPQQEAEVRLSLAGLVTVPPMARVQESRRALALPGLAPATRARHLAWLAYNLAIAGSPAAVAAAGPALAAAEATGDRQAQVVAGLAVAVTDAMRGACAAALVRTGALRRLTRSAHPEPCLQLVELHRADALAGLGRVDEAMSLLSEGLARGVHERNGRLTSAWTQFGSALRVAAGNLTAGSAEAEASTVGALAREVARGSVSGAGRLLTCTQVAVHTGDGRLLDAATAAAGRAADDRTPALRRLAAWIQALAAMARNEPAAAARALAQAPAPFSAALLPNDAGHQPAMARIAVAAGDAELAGRAVAAADAFARASPGVPIIDAVAAQTRALVAGDSSRLVHAAERLRTTQRPLLYAAAAEDAGRALAADGRRAEAVDQLDDAFDAFRAHGATADARRVGRRLRHLGAGRRVTSRDRPERGWESLTPSELRVVRLVAAGATNRDAAQRLFLSPHTVSSHLRSAFARLGINSRVELARVVVEQDAGGS